MIRQLLAHTAAYTFANIVSRGTILVWLIVLPAFMSPADYGALGLIMTTASLVTMLVAAEVTQGLARYYPTAPQEERDGYSRTAWTFTIAMLAVAGVAALAFSPRLNQLLLGSPGYLPAFRLAIVYFALNTSFIFVQNQFRWDFRARDYTIVTLLFSVATLALSIGLAVLLPDALAGVLLGLVSGVAAGITLGAWRLRRTIGFEGDWAKLGRMLRFSVPLAVAGVALFVSTSASRYMLNGMLSLTEVGLFTWASQLAAIPALLLLGVQAAITPLVMKHHREARTPAILARSFETVVAGALCLCLAVGLFTPELVALLGYQSFAAAAPLVMILAPASLMFQLYVFCPGFAVRERTDLQLLVSVVTALAAVVLNYLLIGHMGLMGAAVGTFASSAIFFGCWFTLSGRLYPVPVRWVRLGLFALVTALCAAKSLWPVGGQGHMEVVSKLLIVATSGLTALACGLVSPGQLASIIEQLRTMRSDYG